MSVIKNVDLVYRPGTLSRPQGAEQAPKGDFESQLQNALGEVDKLQRNAEQAIQQMVGEGKGDLQGTMVALEKADVSFRLMMQIRNKVLDAYQEIMRMQV